MDDGDAASTDLMLQHTRSTLGREALTRNLALDLSSLKIFKVVQADVDSDGEQETCFAAGTSAFFSQGVCGLLDPSEDGLRFVELVPYQEGFRDLVVADVDSDGCPEIVSSAQVGSGAFLDLAILRYDGSTVASLFPDRKFHQGLLEYKDLDLDGVDELVIWEGRWEKGAHWQQNPFDIHVYHATADGYYLAFTERLSSSYLPSAIVSREIGLIGIPTEIEHRYTSVSQHRRRLDALLDAGQVTDEYVRELARAQSVLRTEGFLDEALSLVDMAIEANQSLPSTALRRRDLVQLWRERGMTVATLGDYPAAALAFRRVVAGLSDWDDIPVYFEAGIWRELGFIEANLGDYERALAAQEAAFSLLEQADASDPENRAELARLHSNAGLVRSWIGDEELAIEFFGKAIDLDTELGRPFARSIDETGIANVHRTAGRVEEAVTWYEAALTSLSELSDRDRESDANLELGLTLIEIGQLDQGLQRLQRALLLTSVGNIRMQDWKHYLYLGEAYRALRQYDKAERAFRKANSSARRSSTSEVRWQALVGLGLVLRELGRAGDAKVVLDQAIAAVEEFRQQYLPEALKISMLASKTSPYEAVIDLLIRPNGHADTDDWAARAFSYVEQAKSRVFLERLAVSPIRQPDSVTAELSRDETRLINELRALTVRESVRGGEASVSEELDRVEEQLNSIWAQIEASGREGAEYVSLRRGRPIGYDGILDLLHADR